MEVKRFLSKCYPIHLIAFIAAAILQMFWLQRWFSVVGFWEAIKIAIPNLLLVQSFIPIGDYYYGYNSVTWYLSDLAFMHLLTPFLVRLINKIPKRKLRLMIGCVCLGYVFLAFSFRHSGNIQWVLYISPFTRTIDFAIGMMLARQIVTEKKNTQKAKGHFLISTIGIIMFILAIIISRFVPEWLSMSYIYLPGTILTLYGVTVGNSIISKFLSLKVFCWMSRISLELYMFHQIIIRYVETYCTDIGDIPIWKYYGLIVVGTFGISIFLKLIFHQEQKVE